MDLFNKKRKKLEKEIILLNTKIRNRDELIEKFSKSKEELYKENMDLKETNFDLQKENVELTTQIEILYNLISDKAQKETKTINGEKVAKVIKEKAKEEKSKTKRKTTTKKSTKTKKEDK